MPPEPGSAADAPTMRSVEARRRFRVDGPFLVKVAALVILIGVFALLSDRFLTAANLTNILRQISPVVIVGAPVTMLMVARGFDLSVGGVLAFSGIVGVYFSTEVPLPAAFLAAILAGTTFGVLNGFLVVKVGVNAVIATLGTLYVARGAGLLLTGGVTVERIGPGYNFIGAGFIQGIPTPIWVMAGALLVFILLEKRTLLGKYSVAVGSNPDASFLSGVPGNAVRIILFTVCGMMAGLAGLLVSSRLSAGVPTIGVGFEFEVIVATILGGTTLAGGQGTIAGMFVGALILGVLNNGLNILGVQAFWQVVTQGVVLVLAVALDSQLRRVRLRARHR